MGCESKVKVWLVLLGIVVGLIWFGDGQPQPQVPSLFFFGDSIFDNGNNNNLRTAAKANYNPYGIDFPTGATGRFSNGLTLADFLTMFLGFESLIPPYANRSGSGILRGVNYASGAAGILDRTGFQQGAVINFRSQVIHHQLVVAEMKNRLGIEEAQRRLNESLYLVNIGSNDFINNYFMPNFYLSSGLFNLTQYNDLLLRRYSQRIMELQRVGARKFGLFGLGLIGCTPFAIRSTGSSSCVEEQNRAASMFNEGLKSVVDEFNTNTDLQFSFPNASFTFINISAIIKQIVLNSQSLGLRVTNASCCQTNAENGLCERNGRVCENRAEYLLWDDFHSTQSANQFFAILSYNDSNHVFTSPLDINQLASS